MTGKADHVASLLLDNVDGDGGIARAAQPNQHQGTGFTRIGPDDRLDADRETGLLADARDDSRPVSQGDGERVARGVLQSHLERSTRRLAGDKNSDDQRGRHERAPKSCHVVLKCPNLPRLRMPLAGASGIQKRATSNTAPTLGQQIDVTGQGEKSVVDVGEDELASLTFPLATPTAVIPELFVPKTEPPDAMVENMARVHQPGGGHIPRDHIRPIRVVPDVRVRTNGRKLDGPVARL